MGTPVQAVIDIGTHSVLLLVARLRPGPDVEILTHAERVTRLGDGVATSGRLSKEAVERTAAAVEEMAETARRMGAGQPIVVATSAARDAANAGLLLERLGRVGMRPRVLSGEEEARLGFAGVCTDPDLARAELLTIEVGGGSSQVCRGRAGRLESAESVDVGAVRLAERWVRRDPPTREEMERLSADAARAFAAISPGAPGARAVAIGGTAMSLAAISCAEEVALPAEPVAFFRAVDGRRLETKWVEDALAKLARLAEAERSAVPGLPAGRAGMIVAGTAVLLAALTRFGVGRVRVSLRGLRFGLLREG